MTCPSLTLENVPVSVTDSRAYAVQRVIGTLRKPEHDRVADSGLPTTDLTSPGTVDRAEDEQTSGYSGGDE